MFSRKKKSKEKGDKYLKEFENILDNASKQEDKDSKRMEKLMELHDEHTRRSRKYEWSKTMNSYRKTREKIKKNKDYKSKYKDCSLSDMRYLLNYGSVHNESENKYEELFDMTGEMKAEADAFMQGDSLEKAEIALNEYIALQTVSGDYHISLRKAGPIQKKIVKFADRTKNKYSREQLLKLKPYLEALSSRDLRELESSKNLENKTLAILGGVGVVVSLFFLSPIITGNSVANLVLNDSNIIGVISFVLGLFALFISFKNK